jgi:flagellin FlaB
MKLRFKWLKKKDEGAIGIGAMIVFIAMVLVAGIAASVLIQSANTIQLQAMSTGQQTQQEVSAGIDVFDIEGKINVTNGTKYDLKYLAIGVQTRPGSPEIDLNETYITISNGDTEALLRYGGYDTSKNLYVGITSTTGDIFELLNETSWNNTNRETYAIAVMQDADGSLKETKPVLNRGDKAILFIRCSPQASGTFGAEIAERTEVFGQVIPEIGSPGVIHFTTPRSYFDVIYDLQ